MRSIVVVLLCCCVAVAESTSTAPPKALREFTPQLFALTDARIVVSPDKTIEKGTVVFRDGVILAVGADVAVPADARALNLAGKTIYPGLVDAYCDSPATGASAAPRGITATPATPRAEANPSEGGPAHWNREILADFRVDRTYKPDGELNKKLRSQGIVARLAVPARGIVKGTSAVVETTDDEASDAIINPCVAQHLALTPARRGFNPDAPDENRYPSSPMGAYTLVRQTFFDAVWYSRAIAASQQNRTIPAPQRNAALDALCAHLEAKQPFIIDAVDELYDLRAGQIAAEFKIPVIIRGSGQEYRRLAEVSAMNLPIILPLSFPRPPNVASPEQAMNASLSDLMDWDLSPDNPAKLEEAGVTIALSTQGLRDKADFLKSVRKAVARGLSTESALKSLTTVPAKLLGVASSLGTIEVGKSAGFVITDGDLFADKTRIIETWVDGKRFEIAARNVVDVRGKWAFEGAAAQPLELSIEGDISRPSARLSKSDSDEPSTRPARSGGVDAANVSLQDVRLSFSYKNDSFGDDGIALFSAVFDQDSARGVVIGPDGTGSPVTLKRTAPPSTAPTAQAERRGRRRAAADDDQREEPATAPTTQPGPASYAVNYPLGDFGRQDAPEQPRIVIFKNATVWTCGPEGKIEGADVRVEAGRIAAIGRNLDTPSSATVVDCSGRHISPGIIDCHSHMATDGGVNEGGQNITAEVRIGDFVDPDDINIYRQLAAGNTAANVLHGSANAIGGQNQVIKLRWGVGPEELKFDGAPAGIKFALGENPRGANGNAPRDGQGEYPQTRMGVEQLIRNAFAAAQDYRAAQKRYAADPSNNPPVRNDLELEAIAEILEGKRWIHCHSYRQDEILALLRTCDDFNVKVGSLQHILEGYKVADAIAKHGATASSFSDWWAYKIEVYDAIPYNGALMHGRGIVVSFNSDDAELARRLNTESAKATKYGGVPADEALKFVTINPARQLRIDDRVGSIETGKDADLVVWSAPPMSMYAVCQQTWIDGRKYFDRDEDAALRQRDGEMRQKLIQKILASGEPMAGEDDNPPRERVMWPRHDEYCGHDHDDE